MKLIPEGKSYLIGILIFLWILLSAEYLIMPLWIKQRVNQRVIATYRSEARMYQEKLLWLDHTKDGLSWPKEWSISHTANEKGIGVTEAKGPISKRSWNQWLAQLYATPVAATIESCQVRRLSPQKIFVTIRLIQ